MLTRKAYAKINLSLDVLRRRPDGYHEVKMIMQTVDLYDELSFEIIDDEKAFTAGKSDETFQTSNPHIFITFDNLPKDVDLGDINKNLIYRAAAAVYEKYNIEKSVNITLKKNIPVAAGMAGGSTDAAACFRGLNELLKLNMTTDEMCQMAVKIGADVPYCIIGGTALSEGIGEILTPIEAPAQCTLLIAKPDIDVSTKFVYENLHVETRTNHPDVDAMLEQISNQDLIGTAKCLGNILEEVTEKEYPIIKTIKEKMCDCGALNALMSGSGPTVFGLFTSDEDGMQKAKLAAETIKSEGLANHIFISKFIN